MFGKPFGSQTNFERSQLAMRLAQAGVRSDGAVAVFLSAKVILLCVGAVAGLAYGLFVDTSGLFLFVLSGLGAAIGFYLPNGWLSRAADKRSERIGQALPDSLDMLVIAVEAGLGLDAAIQRVGDEMSRTYPELAEEWIIASRETQMGIPRAEAMRKMAERSKVVT